MRSFILFLSFMLSLVLTAQPAQNEYRWGMAYLRSEQYTEAVKSLTKAAEKGNPAAAVQLGMLYHQGRGVEQNDERAVEYYGRAAQKGDAKGQYLLANMMQMGIGTPLKTAKSVASSSLRRFSFVAFPKRILEASRAFLYSSSP